MREKGNAMKKMMVAGMLLALAGTAACNRSGGGANAANAAKGNESAAPAAATDNAAAERDIRALLGEVYAPYASDNAPGGDIARFMEPQLAQAMTADENGIDVDPFIDAQDYSPFKATIQRVSVTGERAEASVGFASFGKSKTLIYDLVRTPGGWKIADIRSGSGTLRSQYKLQPAK
jgi:hypothetical protein